ncbi:MAG: hypothetical protein U0527_01185 [Candidatus Eisenbacteria bacterium]
MQARNRSWFCFRLGIAVLISNSGRNLVVIDDRLVSDPVHWALCLILQETGQGHLSQIVIATCNDTPYTGVGAHIVRVPADGGRGEAEA